MIELRKRDEHSYWNNPEQIKDAHEALSVLVADGGSADPTHLRRYLIDDQFTWEILVPWYRAGSSGADSWGTELYDVDPEIAAQLQQESLVEAYVSKRIGWSHADSERLVITAPATGRLLEFESSLRTKACTLLTPGIHTDLSGKPVQRGSGREHGLAGRFYADFETPQGDTCRVYPQNNEIVCPYPPPKEEAVAAAA